MGAGYVSKHHIRAIRGMKNVSLVGVCDSNFDRASKVAKESGVGAYHNLAEMAAARPDVIHILTPPNSHCALTLQALEMGCHVLVEKPMAPSTEECDRMMAAAARADRILSVSHSARMDPVVLEAQRLVREGAPRPGQPLLGAGRRRPVDDRRRARGALPPDPDLRPLAQRDHRRLPAALGDRPRLGALLRADGRRPDAVAHRLGRTLARGLSRDRKKVLVVGADTPASSSCARCRRRAASATARSASSTTTTKRTCASTAAWLGTPPPAGPDRRVRGRRGHHRHAVGERPADRGHRHVLQEGQRARENPARGLRAHQGLGDDRAAPRGAGRRHPGPP